MAWIRPNRPRAGRIGTRPVSHEPRVQELRDGLQRRGYHPFPLPLDVLLDEENGKPKHTSACVRCDAFDGYPCLVNGKADAQIICVDPALQHPNVTLLTNAFVSRLQTDASGRTVTTVHVERQGKAEEYAAEIVVLSCGAINSALLLLRSANDKHPNGLANNSGVVGHHYMRHNNAALLAISKQANSTVFQKRSRSMISTSARMIGTTRSVISRCSANPTARCSRARRRIGCSGSQRCHLTSWRGTRSIFG
jgi:choline dehydrogenase-like flavoprotein